ncbi:MAG: hypothetical protein M3024_11930 [Candidatus Dormibacteraeota bacterium]|nr:hypothetical protein [Candidatus Dormibacteraeota bacterium]
MRHLVLFLGAGALAACALPGHAARPAASPTPDVAAIVQRLMACIHTHGAPDFPDPTLDPNGNPQWPQGTTKPPDSAIHACQAIYNELPGQAADRPPTAADLALARQFAQCMRQNGFPDWPDPNADGTYTLPQDITREGKSPRLLDAWRNHCARYNPSGHITNSGGG